MFGLEYSRVQVLVQLVGRQRYVDVPHRKNRPGIVIQKLKSMVKRSQGGGLIVRSRALRDPTKMAPRMGEVEEYAEGTQQLRSQIPDLPPSWQLVGPLITQGFWSERGGVCVGDVAEKVLKRSYQRRHL